MLTQNRRQSRSLIFGFILLWFATSLFAQNHSSIHHATLPKKTSSHKTQGNKNPASQKREKHKVASQHTQKTPGKRSSSKENTKLTNQNHKQKNNPSNKKASTTRSTKHTISKKEPRKTVASHKTSPSQKHHHPKEAKSTAKATENKTMPALLLTQPSEAATPLMSDTSLASNSSTATLPDVQTAQSTPLSDTTLPPLSKEITDQEHASASDKTANRMLKDFSKQSAEVKALIKAAFNLSSKNLAYQFGSDNPASGGMDCSGTMRFLLKQLGVSGAPRQASDFYRWVWEKGQFFAVNSHHLNTFEFAELKPGDLLFWTDTYQVDRDPPVTHVMLYLGQGKNGAPLMFGASEGMGVNNEHTRGVTIFDFRLPANSFTHARFIGYGTIPGIHYTS